MYFPTKLDIADMAYMSFQNPDEFTMARRNGFGASDSSILLGVNQWTTCKQLVEQKNSTEITAEERAVGEKPQVRMGNDLEPLVLDKFSQWSGMECSKPADQLRLCDYPQLTINYDGLTDDKIPVECKTVSMFATKHWGWDKAIATPEACARQDAGICVSIKDKVLQQAEMVGIPPYYYTQVQQQLLGTHATYAYLAALNIKDWKLYVFKVLEDEEIQQAIINKSLEVAEQCPHIQAMLDELF